MATVSALSVAGDVLQRNDSVADIARDKHVQIFVTPIEDDEISAAGKHSVDSLDSNSSRRSIEEQVARLREEIAVANNVLELCIREAVTATTTLEKKKLQERTNAASTAWAAKELMLTELLVRGDMFSIYYPFNNTYRRRTLCKTRMTAQHIVPPHNMPGN